MDVFSLRNSVLENYKAFAKSFTTIYAEDIREQIEAIYGQNRFWPEPLIQINPSFNPGQSISQLVQSGDLESLCEKIFQFNRNPLHLHLHQQQAISIAANGESYVVTTGTGSGKSLCFFIPIVDAILKEKKSQKNNKTRAIIIYPMNALANSQKEEIDKFLENIDDSKPIRVARYTGQESEEERRQISENPPDILLTNFMMLELLMTRQSQLDRTVIANCQGLRFLVLDELHTYRGRQGADVALLVRRVRERLGAENLQCIGTSATMVSDGRMEDKNRVVAEVASKLFATTIPDSNVISESLKRVTDKSENAETVINDLKRHLKKPMSPAITDDELLSHPLSIWVETKLGITWSEVDHRWNRAEPKTFSEAVTELAKDSGEDEVTCRNALQNFLLITSIPEIQRTGSSKANEKSFFAFKLHQFISGAGNAYSTLAPIGERKVVVDAQKFLPGTEGTRLYATHFCRECGQEYHPVNMAHTENGNFILARDIDDFIPVVDGQEAESENLNSSERSGFVCVHPDDEDFTFQNRDDDFPETWLEIKKNGAKSLKSNYQKSKPLPLNVSSDGSIGSDGVAVWFLPGRFKFCLRCRNAQSGPGKDRNRLASLSAEGRSSATTVLVESSLRWMHGNDSGLEYEKRKILGFTDNRQDAALQAGHFNDFIFVSLLRAGFLGALMEAGQKGLSSDELGFALQRALGFDRSSREVKVEWLLEPDLRGFNYQEAEKTLRDVLAYRAWFDQRRGWRFTNPNLGQLDLLEVKYQGLLELASDESLYLDGPQILRDASPDVRTKVFRKLLDHLRQGMAVRSQVLDTVQVEQIASKSHSRLKSPWGFGFEEKPRPARWLVFGGVTGGRNLKDEDLIVRGGITSLLGRELKRSKLWNDSPLVRDLNTENYDLLLQTLLNAATTHGLTSEEVTPFDNASGWRLNDACVKFYYKAPSEKASTSKQNQFFIHFYTGLANLLSQSSHPLFGFEAREHTAQVDNERRAFREKRFRFGEKEKQELQNDNQEFKDRGESDRFLPVMFCSPTMELGVDISALNTVYLRNVPPTPANYAQRSGRAGRSGQAALVITYCASQSPHDQYFFRDPKAMVHGQVKPPLIDLANRDLVESHLHAIWLACTEQELPSEISEILDLESESRAVRKEFEVVMSKAEIEKSAIESIQQVLSMLSTELTKERAPWYAGAQLLSEAIARNGFHRFSEAFKRWRDLFKAAEDQRDTAHKIIKSYSTPPKEKRSAESRYNQANQQLELLRGSSRATSDFYTYRYLATEGFLPGYNFPRLPLMAYVPATSDGRGKQTYLQRPRFLALSEFGPRSLVYHEGRAFRVVRALLTLGPNRNANDMKLSTMTARVCQECGAGHFKDELSNCHSCGEPLSNAEIIKEVYRIENVATKQAERITANDEERQRQGFELQTVFEWASRDGVNDVRRGAVKDENGDFLELAYGPSATITRINKGLKRRQNRTQFGFKIDPLSGFWAKIDDEDEGENDPTIVPKQWIVPCVRDQKNALLMNLKGYDFSSKTLATLQYAVLRGIEELFQLDEGEVLGEAIPTKENRTGFLIYEAAEGGAGVLTRLVSEGDSLAKVAKNALKIMHFQVPEELSGLTQDRLIDQPGEHCVAACYKCLMSYYNQPDHELIDRRDETTKEFLIRLAGSRTENLLKNVVAAKAAVTLKQNGSIEKWLNLASNYEVPNPDGSTLIENGEKVDLVWKESYVAASIYDLKKETIINLENKGFEVLVFGEDENKWQPLFDKLKSLVGK